MSTKTIWIVGGLVVLGLIILAVWANRKAKSVGEPIDIVGTQQDNVVGTTVVAGPSRLTPPIAPAGSTGTIDVNTGVLNINTRG
jgi:hypothetical protein